MTVGRDRVDRVIDVIVAVPICSAVATRRAASIAVQLVVRRMPGLPARLPGSPDARSVDARAADRDGTMNPMPPRDAADLVREAGSATPREVIGSMPGAGLPIADYDHLAARQVIDRLRSLDPDEVAVIAAYERGNRRRSTVLGMLEQLGA